MILQTDQTLASQGVSFKGQCTNDNFTKFFSISETAIGGVL